MKFVLPLSINFIEPPGEFQSGRAVREIARAMEAAGVAAGCVSEHPAPPSAWLHGDPAAHDALDPFTALAFVAAATERMKVFTNAVVLPFRAPFITAKAAATLQALSDNRLILGVGTGYLREEFDALGVPYQRRGAMTDEALAAIRLAWRGGAVSMQTERFDARAIEPRPVPAPAPPIWIGGGSDRAIERAARWGDGWMPYFTVPTNDPVVRASSVVSIPHFAEKRQRLLERRAELGMTGPFEIAVNPPLRLEPMKPGEANRLVELAGELAEHGVDWIWTPIPAPTRARFLDHIRWFGDEVIARFAA